MKKRHRGVPLLGEEHVDDLPVLVDRRVPVPPPAGDLDVGRLVNERPVTRNAARSPVRHQPLRPGQVLRPTGL
jgi:hypothetical protein